MSESMKNEIIAAIQGISKEILEIRKEIAELSSGVKKLSEENHHIRLENKALVDVQKKLVHERLKVPEPENRAAEPPAMSKVAKKQAQVTVTRISPSQISVGGQSFHYNSWIKAAGPARFEKDSKTWTLPIECLGALEDNFRGAEGVVLLVSEELRSAAAVSRDSDEELEVKPPALSGFAFQD